jgi:ubiquinol-cytochrome c reductase cytochrome c subunit
MPLVGSAVPQAPRGDQVLFTNQEIANLAAYVDTLGPGPAIPDSELTNGNGNAARGNQLFKENCALCHNFAGSGGALSSGKYAPNLRDATGRHIYEAMLTGPRLPRTGLGGDVRLDLRARNVDRCGRLARLKGRMS